ncbi:iron-containing alcohol dehydrogenase [Cecembia rubra]|uniref:Alcohol dehydrogenase n=1 Tax=Cecembia rubra TaxID=1485585 RepID=A0A2P8E4B2_9BACT|nr:iron-containing alcohol dehydrogenase [Cecembia rubra]PSL04305.1 alcohol dehydrogenase [Cecembia rubra]
MDKGFVFNSPKASIFGKNTLSDLPKLVRDFGTEKVMIVTDRFFIQNGLIDLIRENLENSGLSVVIFSNVRPDPTLENVYEGLELLNESGAGLLIGVGGGSPIDAAKAISILATNPKPLERYMGYHKVQKAGLPLIAIPTTAGTGSEATKVAVITDSVNDVKMMILDKSLMPSASIIDYSLTMTMPPDLTAYVGVDTLTHGIEAFVSLKSNPISDSLALSCIGLVSKHLKKAWEFPEDEQARQGMSLAAFLGGLSFTNSSVGLVHGMSRPLGAIFHLAHGLSNAILLPTVVRYSLKGSPAKYAEISSVMGFAKKGETEESTGMNLVKGLIELNSFLNIPRLSECGKIKSKDFFGSLEKMASDALASGSPQNNPIIPTMEEIVTLYKEAW